MKTWMSPREVTKSWSLVHGSNFGWMPFLMAPRLVWLTVELWFRFTRWKFDSWTTEPCLFLTDRLKPSYYLTIQGLWRPGKVVKSPWI